jgi:hypothetical protein
MSNVLAFRPRPKPPTVADLPLVNEPNSIAIDYITNYLYPWALEQGIDLNSIDFKYDAATIMTVLQGMLHKGNND